LPRLVGTRSSRGGETRDTNWRAAQLRLKRYGEKALKESAARTDELALAGDDDGATQSATLESYEQLALGYPSVLRKADGALIGRCGLMDLVVESATSKHGIRRGWFGHGQAPPSVALIFECELGYTFDPAVWGQGFAAEAAGRVRDYAHYVLGLSHAISAIHPENTCSQRVAERFGARVDGQMEVGGLTWDRYVWPLAIGGTARPQRAGLRSEHRRVSR
jgi:RimJ/RimL family protein N-acetyltransferase